MSMAELWAKHHVAITQEIVVIVAVISIFMWVWIASGKDPKEKERR